MEALNEARKEMVTIYLQAKLKTASREKFPDAADRENFFGDEEIMFRDKPIGKLVGTYILQQKVDKMVTLETGDRLIWASVEKVNPYLDHVDYELEGIDYIFPNGNGVPEPSYVPNDKSV